MDRWEENQEELTMESRAEQFARDFNMVKQLMISEGYVIYRRKNPILDIWEYFHLVNSLETIELCTKLNRKEMSKFFHSI